MSFLRFTVIVCIMLLSCSVSNMVNLKDKDIMSDSQEYNKAINNEPENDNSESIPPEELERPTEEQIKIGEDILKDVWDFCQDMLKEMNELIEYITLIQSDLTLTTGNMFEKAIKPVKNLLKDYNSCKIEQISSDIDSYVNNLLSSLKGCSHTEYAKRKFQNIVNSVTEYLDELQITVTKEVSLCEVMPPEDAGECFQDSRDRAEEFIHKFLTYHLDNIQSEAYVIADEIEGFWLGYTVKGLSVVRNIAKDLEKTLVVYIINNKSNYCEEMYNHVGEILQVRLNLDEEDEEISYLEAKHRQV